MTRPGDEERQNIWTRSRLEGHSDTKITAASGSLITVVKQIFFIKRFHLSFKSEATEKLWTSSRNH